MKRKMTSILSITLFLFFPVTLLSQSISYNIRGNESFKLNFVAPINLNTSELTYNDLVYVLENTLCSDCISLLDFNNLVKVYNKLGKVNKSLLRNTLTHFISLADNGFCPQLPSSGKLDMKLRNSLGIEVK